MFVNQWEPVTGGSLHTLFDYYKITNPALSRFPVGPTNEKLGSNTCIKMWCLPRETKGCYAM